MGIMDVGRGTRRMKLSNGLRVGEGWTNDPRVSYELSKNGVTAEHEGEYEGTHGEGVAGSRPGLSGGAMGGLRAAMGRENHDQYGGGSSLTDRITSSPAMAVKYGLLEDPDVVMHRNAEALKTPKTGVQQELDREDIQTRSAMSMQGLREALGPRENALADTNSERGFERKHLPWAAHDRAESNADLLSKIEKQYLEPAALKSESDAYTAEAGLAGRQATAGASQRDSALKALTELLGNGVKAQGAGSKAFGDTDLQDLRDLILAMSAGGGARGTQSPAAGPSGIRR